MKNPAQNVQSQIYTYSLNRNKANNSIKIPAEKVICFSTSHIAFVDLLEKQNTICAISGSQYVYNETIRQKIETAEIPELGYGSALDLEKIAALKPDVIFAYGVDNNNLQEYQKVESLGIPVVWIGEYLEETMLGRSEWLKVFACFFDDLNFAETQFDSLANNYELLKDNISQFNSQKPLVLTGLPFQGIWYVPGEKSFLANLINDAGGELVIQNKNKRESSALSIEEVFKKGSEATVWLNLNNITSQEMILQSDSRFKNFQPLTKAKLYNNNKRKAGRDGNDFFESSVIHPDKALNDLINIFHKDSIKADELFYYEKL
ncbi:MAG: ABC transporter substrate-binding protein [Bacteroidales bacterium]|nr:ABC transporter substrate-binding protein [Bacteroidales bacterium]